MVIFSFLSESRRSILWHISKLSRKISTRRVLGMSKNINLDALRNALNISFGLYPNCFSKKSRICRPSFLKPARSMSPYVLLMARCWALGQWIAMANPPRRRNVSPCSSATTTIRSASLSPSARGFGVAVFEEEVTNFIEALLVLLNEAGSHHCGLDYFFNQRLRLSRRRPKRHKSVCVLNRVNGKGR
jgi:hypothetical protein